MTQAGKVSNLSHLLCQNLFFPNNHLGGVPVDPPAQPQLPLPTRCEFPFWIPGQASQSTLTAFPKYEFLIERVEEGPQSISIQRVLISLGHLGSSMQSSIRKGLMGDLMEFLPMQPFDYQVPASSLGLKESEKDCVSQALTQTWVSERASWRRRG